jgi:hypothetical protein
MTTDLTAKVNFFRILLARDKQTDMRQKVIVTPAIK